MRSIIDYNPREPAHPDLVARFHDLVALYESLRERQLEIDKAFDSVAREIGMVVTTTLPVLVSIENGKMGKPRLAIEQLSDSIFRKVVESIASGDPIPAFKGRSAELRIYLVWREALALKLRTDWIEPAHYRDFSKEDLLGRLGGRLGEFIPVRPEVMEPAHWFTPGDVLDIEDRLAISAIDEVYPELRLVERVAGYRHGGLTRIPPDVMEPAHRPPFESDRIESLLTELVTLLKARKY